MPLKAPSREVVAMVRMDARASHPAKTASAHETHDSPAFESASTSIYLDLPERNTITTPVRLLSEKCDGFHTPVAKSRLFLLGQ